MARSPKPETLTTPDTILECGHTPTPQPPGSCATGYGTRYDSDYRSCFACCAEDERASMIETGRAMLYLTEPTTTADDRWRITDWPGRLVFYPTSVTRSRTNGFGRMQPRVDVRFVGPDGWVWTGRHQGNNNQLVRCRRTKTRGPDALCL